MKRTTLFIFIILGLGMVTAVACNSSQLTPTLTNTPAPPTSTPIPTNTPTPPTPTPIPTNTSAPPTPTPTNTPAPQTIESTAGTITITNVLLTKRWPPDCDPDVQYSCVGEAVDGFQIIAFYLAAVDGHELGSMPSDMSDLADGTYVTYTANTKNFTERDFTMWGFDTTGAFIAFSVAENAQDIQLAWSGNSPISISVDEK